MAFHQLTASQELPADLSTVWAFISRPENLKRITPPHMGFEITSRNLPEVMYPGMIISYRISPLAGIRMTWVTEITQVREQRYFVDEQRVGPYAMWHHEHWLKPTDKGVLMTDLVSYKLPLGLLGELAHPLFVRRQLDGIFDHRRRALETHFGRC